MFSHVTVGTNEFAKARKFYAAVMAALGHKAKMDADGFVSYGEPAGPKLFVLPPFDKKLASVGNGTHAAFICDTREKVDAFYKAALENGGSDEGAPGPRPHYHPNYYGTYVRDPVGNKLQAVCHKKQIG
jgi:catechol 2,3-dioxygenase-like lactoylglutathione lyase family enzyme